MGFLLYLVIRKNSNSSIIQKKMTDSLINKIIICIIGNL